MNRKRTYLALAVAATVAALGLAALHLRGPNLPPGVSLDAIVASADAEGPVTEALLKATKAAKEGDKDAAATECAGELTFTLRAARDTQPTGDPGLDDAWERLLYALDHYALACATGDDTAAQGYLDSVHEASSSMITRLETLNG